MKLDNFNYNFNKVGNSAGAVTYNRLSLIYLDTYEGSNWIELAIIQKFFANNREIQSSGVAFEYSNNGNNKYQFRYGY